MCFAYHFSSSHVGSKNAPGVDFDREHVLLRGPKNQFVVVVVIFSELLVKVMFMALKVANCS